MRMSGTFNDGQTAVSHPVRVYLLGNGLDIHAEEKDGPRLTWPVQGLYLVEEVYPGRPIRLRHAEQREATLTLTDPAAPAFFAQHLAGQLGAKRLRARIPMWMVPIMAVLVLAVVGALLWAVPQASLVLTPLVPNAVEESLGETVMEQLISDHALCEAPEGLAVLERLTARLTEGEELALPVQVHVSSDPGVNAFAAPGGHVVILNGLLQSAESPEELTGVLAHELAHQMERHPLRGLIRMLGISLTIQLIIGDVSGLQAAIAQASEVLLLLSYTREDEATADRIGVRLLNEADIRGDGLVDFFARLGGTPDDEEEPDEETAPADAARDTGAGKDAVDTGSSEGDEEEDENSGGLVKMLSTHPMHGERVRAIRAMSTGKGPAMSKADWQTLRAICPAEEESKTKKAG